MKKNLFLVLLSAAMLCACQSAVECVPANEQSVFSSSDKALEESYTWARNMAYSYAHTDHDPVGFWYEAALPHREAFCMRDVSHQTIGAHILGLQEHNKNMMEKFAENITEQKDWCSYWEINRYNKPAPADYDNDSTFWYNLPANFDVTQACLRLYEWTGDKDYVEDEVFLNFYEKSLNEYVERWNLKPENAFKRERYMNKAANFDYGNTFHVCRGLSSYAETFPGITMSLDLLSSMYAANKAYSKIAEMNGTKQDVEEYAVRAEEYKRIVEDKFWDADSVRYNTFWTQSQEFHRGEGVPFVLWFDVTDNVERRRAAIADILDDEWNVENLSAFPAILYRNGYIADAHRITLALPKMRRSEYPEVSFGVVEGVISGAMGIEPKLSEGVITTCARLGGATAEVKNVPLADGYISLKHEAATSTLTNNTSKELAWEVVFVGDYSTIEVGGKSYPTEKSDDTFGNVISQCKVTIKSGKSLTAVAK